MKLKYQSFEKPGSMKIGYNISGTRIQYIQMMILIIMKKPIINLAWHISDEIKNCTKWF